MQDQNPNLVNFSNTVRNGAVYTVEFHEDKHYAQIKKTVGQTEEVFILNSAGSPKYENYSDSGSVVYTAVDSVPFALTLDGNGPFEDRRFSPPAVSHPLYNSVSKNIDLTDVPVGTLVHITYDIELTPSSSNEDVHIYFKFAAFGGYKLFVTDGSMRQSSTVHHYSGTKTFFVINEDVQQHGVQLMVETTCDTVVKPNFLMVALL